MKIQMNSIDEIWSLYSTMTLKIKTKQHYIKCNITVNTTKLQKFEQHAVVLSEMLLCFLRL